MSDVTVDVTAEPSVDISVDATIVEANIFTQAVNIPAGEGLKTYAGMAELDDVRTAEVGILHLEDTLAAFPTLPNAGHGPSDLIVTTTTVDYVTDAPPYEGVVLLVQAFYVGVTLPSIVWYTRYGLWDEATNSFVVPWSSWSAQNTPTPVASSTPAVIYSNNSTFSTYGVDDGTTANSNNVVRRLGSSAGGIRITNLPAVGTDAANKNYVDSAVSANAAKYSSAPPTTGFNVRGAIVWNNLAAVGDYAGWICVAGGIPGQWRRFGLIVA